MHNNMMTERFDWNNLQYFTLLVTHGTLSATADVLGVQHSTVARRISELERALGVVLFDRIGKRYVLTKHGANLYKSAHQINHHIHKLQKDAQQEQLLATQVTVSLPPMITRWVLAHLADFYEQHPKIRLVLHSSTELSDLHDRQADIALRIIYPDKSDLVVRRVRDLSFGFFAKSAYLACTPEQDRRYFALSTKNTLSAWADGMIEGCMVAMRCNDFEIIYQAVMAGLGVGLLPIDSVQNTDLVAAKAQTLTQPLYLVMHEDIRQIPKVRVVADFLGQVLGRIMRHADTVG